MAKVSKTALWQVLDLGVVLSLAASASSCVPGGDPHNQPPPVDPEAASWLALPTAAPTTYAAGIETPLAQAVIDGSGGILEGPAGSLLDGVTVSFAAGAVSAPTTFTLGYDEGGTFTNLAAEHLSGIVLVLTSDGASEFPVPVTVRYPHTDPVSIPVPFHLRPDGGLTLMQPLPLDRINGRAGFITRHASNFTWINYQPESSDPFITGFDPGRDGFAFNNGVVDEFAPIGRCVGIANYSKWYRQTHGGGLIGRYSAVVSSKASEKLLSGEEVLATRAHTSVMLDATDPVALANREALVVIQSGVSTGSEVVIGVSFDSGEGSHAILAIGFSDNQIAVYDSNHPGKWKAIDYRFDPAGGEAWLAYGDKNALTIFGDMPRVESFPAMTRDADKTFHDESQTKIEITSHSNGQTVDVDEITLQGKVHSGQVQITEANVWVRYEDSSESERQTLTFSDDNRDFSVTLKLLGGTNRILFKTKGYTIVSEGLVEIKNDLEKDEDKFQIKYDPDDKQGNLTFVQTNTWGTFAYEGDAEIFYNGPDDPDGGDGDYIDYTQWTVTGEITNKTTFATNENGSPCTLSTAAVQAIPAGVVFRVWKSDPPTADFSGLQLIWNYTCEDNHDIGGLLYFETRTGAYCAALAHAPIDDLVSPAGTFTMSCMATLQPEIGTITGTWDFQP